MVYSADKGDKLYEVQTGLRGGMGPPITYQVDGKQYVSLMGGTGQVRFTPPGGAAAPAPAAAAPAAAGDGVHEAPPTPAPAKPAAGAGGGGPGGFGGPAVTPKLLTFVLDGQTPMPVSTPIPPAQP